ncbi:hypothetical protein VNO78_18239 [Psophocarpus tetragonolobus]|uniref:Uncharacterized protein n=1 Tax=Psophocarpus tetragonolobus TaxID=3891 RepID=A0AAN9SJ37_PSOTE
MGGKYFLSLLFVFKLFKSNNKKGKGGVRSDRGGCETLRHWPSDYDKGTWGVASPNIDNKARIFIDNQKNRLYHQP